MRIEEHAYFAGLIDGEGCITLDRRGLARPNSRTPSVQINITDKGVVEALQQAYGGCARLKPVSKTNPKWQDQWVWRVRNRQAKDCLLAVLPFLRIKNAKAREVLDYMAVERKRGPAKS